MTAENRGLFREKFGIVAPSMELSGYGYEPYAKEGLYGFENNITFPEIEALMQKSLDTGIDYVFEAVKHNKFIHTPGDI